MKAIFTLFVRIVSFAVVSLSFRQIIIDICNFNDPDRRAFVELSLWPCSIEKSSYCIYGKW